MYDINGDTRADLGYGEDEDVIRCTLCFTFHTLEGGCSENEEPRVSPFERLRLAHQLPVNDITGTFPSTR